MNIDIHVHVYGRGDGGTGCSIRGTFYHSLLIPFLKLYHTGGEHVLRTLNKKYRDPERLKLALDCGVTVIAAHCGMKSGIMDRDYLATFSALARCYPDFYGDTAAFLVPTRRKALKKLMNDRETLQKLLHEATCLFRAFRHRSPGSSLSTR